MTLTNADKVLYPATGTTKSDIFDYYAGVAEVMLGHIAGRPATRKRWPNGVDQPAFFEKQLALSAPPWLSRATVAHRSGTTTYPIIDSATGLAWIAQQAALEVHVPQWRFVAEPGSGELNPGPATRLVFDLDPGEGVMMAQLAEVARAVRDLLADIGLVTFPVTSGSKGLHLYTPLDEPVSSRGATVLAKRVAQRLEQAMPALVTSTMTKSLRAGKVFVDWSQNSGSKTTIAPYSLRGRTHPTVAAPRTWAELDDPALRQLSYDEVLTRIARDGDLLERLDADAPVADRLTRYRRMRDASKTPEPIPTAKPVTGDGNTFVIQEHHARRPHYDFRLERDGVLVSWAVPKNLPDNTSVNHLAIHTEDHPLEYATFEGAIPSGEYGAGKVIIWDSGTYDTEKFHDDPHTGEVIVNLHGGRISGRYALIRTNGDRWLGARLGSGKLWANKATIETNLVAALVQIETALDMFNQRGSGHLVLISSVLGVKGVPGVKAAYAASKAGVRSLGESLRAEYAQRPIRVTVLEPGYIESEMTAKSASTMLMVDNATGVKALVAAIEREPGRAAVPWWPWAPLVRLMWVLPPRLTRRFA